MKKYSLEEEIKEKDKRQLNKMKNQEELRKATLNSFKEDLYSHLYKVLTNLHKMYMVNIMYKFEDNKLYDFFDYEDFSVVIQGYKKDIIKHLMKKAEKYGDFEDISKQDVFTYLNSNFEKIYNKASNDFQNYFDFELKEEIIDEYLRNKDKIIKEPNIIVYKNKFGDNIRKYVDFQSNLMIEDNNLNIIEIPHFIPPIEEVKKVEIENKKTEIDAKFKYVLGFTIGIMIAIFNLIISPILFLITAIILVTLGAIVKVKQPKGFGKK